MDNKKIFQLLFSIIAPLALMACAPKLPQATLVPIPPTPAQVVPPPAAGHVIQPAVAGDVQGNG